MLRSLIRVSFRTARHTLQPLPISIRPPRLTALSSRYFSATYTTKMSSEKVDTPAATVPAEQANPAAPASKAEDKPAAPGAEGEEEGDGKISKSAAKKAAKAAEKAAKQAARGGAVEKKPWGESKKDKQEKAKVQGVSVTEWVNPTPEGEKKDVSGDMPVTGYDPIQVEAAHYAWWKQQGYFRPKYQEDGKPLPRGCFSISLPPPNVTGSLHCGHALTIALEDALVRWKRMQGYTVLFTPGYDHAGIATQAVVEARLMKTEGHGRHHYGREKFLEKVWEWKEQYESRISTQMARLGGSHDWDRVAFTMSDALSKAVTEAFVTLHERKVIYRANRLVNWCVYLNTSLSDVEVDSLPLTGRTLMNVKGYDAKERFEFGVITSFAYPIENSDEKIIVATTRPETMLGDTAVAVHPDDSRYTHLHGKFVINPFNGRRIPIITDSITVDMEFGTGAVKITPAHDANDFECGQRNNLEFINLMNDDGTYNENAGEYKGMRRFHVRNEVIKALKEKGLYIEQKDNEMQVPICSRSGDVIEQIMKPQWWVSCKPMAAEALKRTEAGELKIQPKVSAGDWTRWLEGMRDWCISRQLWWGHRCPAYLIKYEGESVNTADDANWIVARTKEEAEAKAEAAAGGRKYTLEQDEDVLDTWFSSGLWPFSILGWPEKTPELANFYPNSILETGWDILFFWVARMVFFGIEFTGQMPFKEVYCHPMVRDAFGRKMSKSLGNVIDPIDVINGATLEKLHGDLRLGNLPEKEIIKAEDGQKKIFPKGIPQCGTDALRFALCNFTSGGRDINLDVSRIEGYRKFCNKLWNATKFCLFRMGLVDLEGKRLQSTFVPNKSSLPTGQESVAEKWLFHKLNYASETVNSAMETRDFERASSAAYHFFLNDLCDVFIEATKPLFESNVESAEQVSAQNTLYTCLEGGLKLLHPYMPYVTEDLWQRLPRRPEDTCESIMIASFPEKISEQDFPQAAADFDLTNDTIRAARSIVGLYNLPTNGKTIEDKITVIIQSKKAEIADMLQKQKDIIIALTKGCGTCKFISSDFEVPQGCGSEVVTADVTVHIPVQGRVDAVAEISKLEKKQVLAEQNKGKLLKTTQQPGYEKTAKEEVRQQNQERMEKLDAEIESLTLAMERFKALM